MNKRGKQDVIRPVHPVDQGKKPNIFTINYLLFIRVAELGWI